MISSLWLLDQCALDDRLRERARTILAGAAADAESRAAVAHLLLFDARVARRRHDRRTANPLALQAAQRFAEIGWPWDEAQAWEVAGEAARALAIYERHGMTGEARRVTEARRRTRHRPHAATLTPRETEIARLAASGMSNRRIGETLFISRRTVETHIASIFDRFDLTSRVQLVDLLASQPAE